MEEVAGGGSTVSVITDFGDYRKFNGILIPNAVTINGAMPMPLNLKADLVEVDGQVDPALFQIK